MRRTRVTPQWRIFETSIFDRFIFGLLFPKYTWKLLHNFQSHSANQKSQRSYSSRRLFFPTEGFPSIYLCTSCSIYEADIKTSLAMSSRKLSWVFSLSFSDSALLRLENDRCICISHPKFKIICEEKCGKSAKYRIDRSEAYLSTPQWGLFETSRFTHFYHKLFQLNNYHNIFVSYFYKTVSI